MAVLSREKFEVASFFVIAFDGVDLLFYLKDKDDEVRHLRSLEIRWKSYSSFEPLRQQSALNINSRLKKIYLF